jgi:superfamily II DNA helicase RecQ
MQIKFFSVPIPDGTVMEEELNRFLRAHRVLQVRKELVVLPAGACWAVAVDYLIHTGGELPGEVRRDKLDYKMILNEEQFAVFSKLRAARKELAEKEGVPVYAVFTNEQLAAMVQTKAASKSALEKIEGVGAARTAKYGEAMLRVLAPAPAETNP